MVSESTRDHELRQWMKSPWAATLGVDRRSRRLGRLVRHNEDVVCLKWE